MIEIIQMATPMIGYCCILLVPGGTFGSLPRNEPPAFCFENVSKNQNDGIEYFTRADGTNTKVFKIGPNIKSCLKPSDKKPCLDGNPECKPVS
jgi:hypothetical protein